MKTSKMVEKLQNGLSKPEAKKLAEAFVFVFGEDDIVKDEVVKSKKSLPKNVTNQDKQLAEQLSIRISEFIDQVGYSFEKPTVDDLALSISRLHRIDKESYENIDKLIHYLYEVYEPRGEFDWRMQVRSGSGFRRNYKKIMITVAQQYRNYKRNEIVDVR